MERVNPLKRIRTNQGISLDRFSKQFGISRQLIINNENGTYANPSPALLAALAEFVPDEINDPSLLREYHLWQRDTRRANYGVLIEPVPKDLSGHVLHPVVRWAEYSGIPYNRISKLYCIHQGLMDRLKNQPNLMNYLPSAFTDALIDSGYKMETVDELESRFQTYKHNPRCKVVSGQVSKSGS
jgi:transcriptional regulator with XRE-family HTH domain